ncbi:MAG TPA: DUF4350 domain-containing protein [Pirellulaceae bacterium]|jgi:hypothetical protein
MPADIKSPTQNSVTANLTWPILGIVAALALVGLGIALAGRRDEQLPVVYGRRRGSDAAGSVNGTAVLADLYRTSGRRVSTGIRFSPSLEKYNTIVWFPDDFDPPDDAHRTRLEDWLKNGGNRTLVYVGRDYDASIAYWQSVKANAPPELADEIVRREAEARAGHEAERSIMPESENIPWFTVQRDHPPLHSDKLTGPWAKEIDVEQADVYLEGSICIPAKPESDVEFETLLECDGELLVFRVTKDDWNGGQIIIVANGSFTLNYPLVNHEHRKLAAKLIEASSSTDDRVIFIESEAGGPPIRDKEKATSPPTAMELLKVWPLNAILLHIAVLGLVLLLARAPIFGRPRDLPNDSTADFGKHVAALGKLLAATKDRNYAQARLNQYRQAAGPKKATKIK